MKVHVFIRDAGGCDVRDFVVSDDSSVVEAESLADSTYEAVVAGYSVHVYPLCDDEGCPQHGTNHVCVSA